MKVKVLFFGLTHDLTGFGEEHLEIPEGENLEGLWRQYTGRYPRLTTVGNALLVAVNQEFRGWAHPLQDGDEVAFMPPVSGGASEDFYLLTREPIPTAELSRQLKAPGDGAVAIFEGIVRDHSGGRRTLYLEYEAYEPMALRKMQEIGQEARQKFSIDRIGMIHRLGRLEIGETSVAILVTSEHRRAALEACHYLIERLKQIVPIWKKEYCGDGEVWVEGEDRGRLLQPAGNPKV